MLLCTAKHLLSSTETADICFLRKGAFIAQAGTGRLPHFQIRSRSNRQQQKNCGISHLRNTKKEPESLSSKASG